jgi:hypothetical protein
MAIVVERPAIRDGNGDRLVQLRVEPDRRPFVRIVAPGKDLIFSEAAAAVPVSIEARDDIALSSLVLRYTKVAGSGETFTFEEGEVPVTIARSSPGSWTAHASLDLATLALGDGDTLVYRALARDAKPGADPSFSDSYLVEIGRLAGVASTGFAIPEERDRQAISQQMLIIKTEKLHASRDTMTREGFADQARLLAIEQRMVKAEFVFMTGGEVADEVDEATHAHELAEGRFENEGQVELLAAIREMSRAEARLNAADTAAALGFERAALRALQRAFDRRRYLLRTLPERTRIDPAQRLTGDRSEARPATRSTGPAEDAEVPALRRGLTDVAAAHRTGMPLSAARAAEILGLAADSSLLQKSIAAAAAARDDETRTRSLRELERVLTDLLRARLAAPPLDGVRRDPLGGRLVAHSRRDKEP